MSRATRNHQCSAVALCSILGLAGCGGRRSPVASSPSPTPPPTPRPPIVLTLLSGETETPVTDASVVLGADSRGTDPSGRVTLPESARPGDPLDVIAPGFFDRLTTVPSASTTIGLWPLRSPTGLTETYTGRLVYSATGSGTPLGGEPLVRPTEPVFLVPTPDFQGDQKAMDELQYAAAMTTEATGGRLPFSVATAAPTSGVRFDVKLDPTNADCPGALAFCRRLTRGGTITGGEIVFCHPGAMYDRTVTHEVGHAFGLRHSPGWYDVMSLYNGTMRTSPTFTASEQVVMRLMLQRPPGNRYPDTDRAPGSTAVRVDTIICR